MPDEFALGRVKPLASAGAQHGRATRTARLLEVLLVVALGFVE
jgi:hypothetical protein